MSLYNLIHGVNPIAAQLLASLEITVREIDRFRDASLYNKDLKEGEYLIRILTRTGGSNRDLHQASIKNLRENKHFLRDEDDGHDSTYMYFFFEVPPVLLQQILVASRAYPDEFHKLCVDNDGIFKKHDTVVSIISSRENYVKATGLSCGCHCSGGCGDPYAACTRPCKDHVPY